MHALAGVLHRPHHHDTDSAALRHQQPERGPHPALREELERFEEALDEAGKARHTVHTYVDRASRFVAWLAGENTPQSS